MLDVKIEIGITWERLGEIIAAMTPEERQQPVTAKTISSEYCTQAYWENGLKFYDGYDDPELSQYGDATK